MTAVGLRPAIAHEAQKSPKRIDLLYVMRPWQYLVVPRKPRQAALSDGPHLDLVSAKELAKMVRVGEQTIRRSAARGEIPYVRLGNQLRFDVLAVKAAIMKRSAK